jgi:N-acyl amino acid synthase of PEP-CTERM/exosortase system
MGSSLVALYTEPSDAERRTFPLISIALIAASTSMAILVRRPNVFIIAEDWLAILLKRLGLDFVRVGDTVDYHGPRAAFFISAEQALRDMKGELREIYGHIHASLEAEACQEGIPLNA